MSVTAASMKGIQWLLGRAKPDEKREQCAHTYQWQHRRSCSPTPSPPNLCWPELTFSHSLTQATKEHVVLWQSKRGTVLVCCWLQRQQVSYSHGSSTWDPPCPSPYLNLAVCTVFVNQTHARPMAGISSTALQLNMQQGHYCHLWQHGDNTGWI